MRFGPVDIWDTSEGFGEKKGLFLRGRGRTVLALLNLFFLRGIVNSTHPEGVWLLKGLCRCGKN